MIKINFDFAFKNACKNSNLKKKNEWKHHKSKKSQPLKWNK